MIHMIFLIKNVNLKMNFVYKIMPIVELFLFGDTSSARQYKNIYFAKILYNSPRSRTKKN